MYIPYKMPITFQDFTNFITFPGLEITFKMRLPHLS